MIHHAELPRRVLETQSFLIHMTLTERQSKTVTASTHIVQKTESRAIVADFTRHWTCYAPNPDHFTD